jgi:hypothetical protein
LGGTGLELTSLEQSKTPISASGGTESGTLNAQNTPKTPQDPDLALVVDNPKTAQNQVKDLPADLAEIVSVWPQLSEAIRSAIVGLVRASNNK